MLVAFSVFAEQPNGNPRWDFNENGERFDRGDLPDQLRTLDQSINAEFAAGSNLLVLARDLRGGRVRTWIGMYLHDRVARGGNGTQGAGVWLDNATASGEAIVRFLQDVTAAWSKLPVAQKDGTTRWEMFDPDCRLLERLKHQDWCQTATPRQLDIRASTCVVDLAEDTDPSAIAAWLDKAQTCNGLDRRKRIFFTDNVYIKQKLVQCGHLVINETVAERRSSCLTEVLKQEEPTDPTSLPPWPQASGQAERDAQLGAALDMLKARVNRESDEFRRRFDSNEKTLARQATDARRATLLVAPLLVLCTVVSLAEVASSLGILASPALPSVVELSGPVQPAAHSVGHVAQPPVAAVPELSAAAAVVSKPSAAAASPGPVPSASDQDQTIRKMTQLDQQILKLLDKQQLTASDISQLRKLATDGVAAGQSAAP